jgi:hypothetical protein
MYVHDTKVSYVCATYQTLFKPKSSSSTDTESKMGET